MSNQGNVIVRASGDCNCPTDLIFQTGRWSGGMMHSWVRDILKHAFDRDTGGRNEECFLYDLCRHSSIGHPIREVGNEDVPTIVIDWKARTVSFEWISYSQEMLNKYHDGQRVLACWPMAQFIAEDPKTFQSWYDS